MFIFTRSNVDPAHALTINYTMGGSASFGTDYVLTGPTGHVTIPAGQSSAIVTLTSMSDLTVERKETAKLSLGAGTGYTLGKNKKSATVKIKG